MSYEELYAQPELYLKQLLDFLGLESTDAEVAGAVQGNSAEETRKGGGTAIPLAGALATASGQVEEPAGFVRRGQPGGWRQDLSWWQRRVVRNVTHPLFPGSTPESGHGD